METQNIRNADNNINNNEPPISRVIDRMLLTRRNGSCKSSNSRPSIAAGDDRTPTRCIGWTGNKSSPSPAIIPPRFHETESSSDDSDGSSSKGRRRFRLGRKRQSWTNLARTNRDSQHHSSRPSSTSGLVEEGMLEEVALQRSNVCGGVSEVSSLSCLEVCSDEEYLEAFCSDDDCSMKSAQTSTRMVVITNANLLLHNEELQY
ncbi:hypothetical protein MHU86_15665 [Fragilaria crotonensis]|nr:hypothetical protein MHU86_15665 [Fragilaria crotonensis]